jgi:hypothetical protein
VEEEDEETAKPLAHVKMTSLDHFSPDRQRKKREREIERERGREREREK